jgi:hypothetical protein
MATEYKTLGQTVTAAAIDTYSTLYELPPAYAAVVSNLHICNLTDAEQTVRVACSAALTPTNEEFIVYNLKIDGNEAYPLVIGMTMANSGVNPTKYIRVSSTSASVSFAAFGAEQT